MTIPILLKNKSGKSILIKLQIKRRININVNSSNRKFIFGRLEIRKLIISDFLYLAVYTSGLIYYFYASKCIPENKFITSWIMSFIAGFQTISSPFGLRFRNIIFSILWLILSVVLLIDNYFISLIPIFTFILYHVIRIVFWKNNNREFIPYEIGKGNMYRYKSTFEGKYGDLKDKKYTKILFTIGLLIILFCFIQTIRLKN